jgi:hypothetical protein
MNALSVEDASPDLATHAPDTLHHELRRTWLLVGRHIARYGYRLAGDHGSLGDALTGFAHAQRLDDADAPRWCDAIPTAATMDRQLAQLEACAPEFSDPAADLQRRTHLDSVDFRLLMTQSTLETCPDLLRAADLARSGGAPAPFLAELVANDPADARRLTRRLAPTATLIRRGFMNEDCTVADAVLDALCHVARPAPPAVVAVAALPPGKLILAHPTAVDWDGPIPLLVGPAGVGKEALLATSAREAGRALWTVELAYLTASGRSDALLTEVCLEACVAGASLHLRIGDVELQAAELARLRAVLADVSVPWAMSAGNDSCASALAATRRHDLPAPDSKAQHGLWLRQTGDDALARRLTGLFRLTPGRIVHACATAPHLTAESLAATVRAGCKHRLGDLADPVTCTHNWEDLVVPDRVRTSLREVAMQGRLRFEVLSTWGFEERLGYGTGLSCLFFGPPGTGKTMTAGLIARELGLPMYRVDLSRVVSKYIGETEKNLRRLFAEASSARAILLFDEADGLFAKRTKVKDSKDRFANMEVAFLLQQMEAYDGISILTTNLEADLDEALRRRLRFRVYFPAPDEHERAELWRRMLPPAADVDLDDIDFDVLGESFEFSGGYVRNAALRAAFRAAAAGHPIDHDTLYDAARAEAAELGMLVRHD